MKKLIVLLLAISMVISLAACGSKEGKAPAESESSESASSESSEETEEESSSAEEPESSEEVVEEVHDVDTIALETEDGTITYSGYEYAGPTFYNEYADGDASKTLIVNFDFTNKAAKPTGVQSVFAIKVYQKGAELSSPDSWGESTEAMNNFFNGSAMKDGTLSIGRAYVINDYSPISIMVESTSNPDTYQMMEVEITEPTIEESEAETEETPVSAAEELKIGDTLSLEFVEMTFDEWGIAEDIKQSITTGNVTRTFGPEPESGNQYIFIKGSIKNLNTEDLPVYDYFIGEFDINGYKYTVSANECYVYTETGEHESMIAPLTTCNYYLYAKIPDELASASEQQISYRFGFYDLFDNYELAKNRSFEDDPISLCPYQYIFQLQ